MLDNARCLFYGFRSGSESTYRC